MDLLEQMRQEDNLVLIARLKTDLIKSIEEEPYRFQGRFYKRYIKDLFDIIDDYERGEREAAVKKLHDLWDGLDL